MHIVATLPREPAILLPCLLKLLPLRTLLLPLPDPQLLEVDVPSIKGWTVSARSWTFELQEPSQLARVDAVGGHEFCQLTAESRLCNRTFDEVVDLFADIVTGVVNRYPLVFFAVEVDNGKVGCG